MKGEALDQAAHAAAAIILALPVLLWPSVATCAWAGFVAGMIREVTEEGHPVTFRKIGRALGSWEDLLGWTIGGALAGLIASSWKGDLPWL